MFEKHIRKSDILSKDAGHRPASLLKMSIFDRCFSKHFASKNQLPSFYISGTLVENGLRLTQRHAELTQFRLRTIQWKFDYK